MIENIKTEGNELSYRHFSHDFTRLKRVEYDSEGNRIKDDQKDYQINEEFLNTLARHCRKLDAVKPLLILDYIRETHHIRDAQAVLVMLCGMTRIAINDEDYRAHLNMWLNGESDSSALRSLVADSLGDRQNYYNSKQVAHQIDVIDFAWAHADEHEKHLARMEEIRQFAVEWGARFADVCVDHDLSYSDEFCRTRRNMMDPDDLDRFNTISHAGEQASSPDEPEPG